MSTPTKTLRVAENDSAELARLDRFETHFICAKAAGHLKDPDLQELARTIAETELVLGLREHLDARES